LTNFAPLSTTIWQARIFSPGEQQVSENDFSPGIRPPLPPRRTAAKNAFVIAVLEPSDIENDINFLRAIIQWPPRFQRFTSPDMAASGKPTTQAT